MFAPRERGSEPPVSSHPVRAGLSSSESELPPRAARPGGIREGARVLRLALRAGRDPLPFYRQAAAGAVRYLRGLSVPLAGARILDAGTGTGAIAEALSAAGARVVALDLDDRRPPAVTRTPFVRGSAERLPFRQGAFDGVISSNVLEHVPDPFAMVRELTGACRPGGFVYLSWTNWLSPFGGHEMSPFHYLGPRLAARAYGWVRGRPPHTNVPGRNLFVLHVGDVLRRLRGSGLVIRDVAPRYWPSLRFIARVPVLREVAMWNCVILLRRPGRGGGGPERRPVR